VFLFYACQLQGNPKVEDKITRSDKIPGKEDMFLSFNKHRTLLIIYGSQDPATEAAYLTWAEKLKERLGNGRRPLKVLIQSDKTYKPEQWKELPGFLIGTPSSNKLLARIGSQLPFDQKQQSFELDGKRFDQEDEAFQLSFYPNPDSIWTPLNVISGNSEAAVLKLLEQLTNRRRFSLFNSLPYQIYQGNKRIALGDFDDSWNIDPDISWYFDPDPSAVFQQKGVALYYQSLAPTEAETQKTGERIINSLAKVQEFLNPEKELPELSVIVYGSPEVMGMMKDEMKEYMLDEEVNTIHKLAHPYFPDPQCEGEITWATRHLIGKAFHPVFEKGLSIFFCENWQRKGYQYWAANLFRSGDILSIEELLYAEYGDYTSPLQIGALSASLVSFLLQEWGKENFLQNYQTWKPDKGDLRNLDKKWKQYQKEQAQLFPASQRIVKLPAYLKGMTFAHEGYSVYNGFGSSLAKKSLEEISKHHANMVSIVPYSGTREIHKPMPFRISSSAGSENDVSVVFASKAAQELGMVSMMKPQIYFGGSWPGDLEMKNKEDWNMFFAHYRRWILHYTLLAEIHEFDMLCIGTEFVKATQAHPEIWKGLVVDMRKIFSGKITYAANWGEEIEKFSPLFSAQLDLLGVDCYYPLSKKDKANDKELQKGFAETMKKLKQISNKHEKPMIFTEIGFRSVPQAWKQPHAEAVDDQATEEDQARCYQVVLEAMKGQDWQVGMAWWKWPSYMTYGSRSPQSFSPAGKLAAQVLKEYYGNPEIWE